MAEGDYYDFSPRFESIVAALSSRSREFYGRVGYAVDPERLNAEPNQLIIRAAQVIAQENGAGPDQDILVVQRIRRWVGEGQVTKKAFKAACQVFEWFDEEYAGLMSIDGTIAETVPVLQSHESKDISRLALEEQARGGDMRAVQERIEYMNRLGARDVSLGSKFGHDLRSRLKLLKARSVFETGIEALDNHEGGGFSRGGLVTILADTGGGKSLTLSEIHAIAQVHNYLAVSVTLELPIEHIEARQLAALTGQLTNDILEDRSEEPWRRLERIQPEITQGYIHGMPPDMATAQDVLDWVGRVEQQEGREVDVLIVDYADRLAYHHAPTRYEGALITYESLRRWAIENKRWVFTASQASKPSGKKLLDANFFADSYNKGRVSDVAFSINPRYSENDPSNAYVEYIDLNVFKDLLRGPAIIPQQFSDRRRGVNLQSKFLPHPTIQREMQQGMFGSAEGGVQENEASELADGEGG